MGRPLERDDQLITDGYIDVPTGPGLGIELDDDIVAEHLHAESTGFD